MTRYFSLPTLSYHLRQTNLALFSEPLCISPAFIVRHPQVMSPLAKQYHSCLGLCECFEGFSVGRSSAFSSLLMLRLRHAICQQ
ncbi:hypothetical protein L208DRAFT_1323217 [Tricholoma matsutake]|nr:hypothetical protein L208DRAFT_1323217 [Tricholoma matsutake 945]